MNGGEGGYASAEEHRSYLRGEFVTSIDFGTAFPGGFYPDISVGPFFPGFAAYSQLPALRVLPTPAATLDPTPAPVGVDEVSVAAAAVIDPEFQPTATVYEEAPGGIYETSRAPTDWGRVYEEYVILNPPVPPVVVYEPTIPVPVIEEEDVAFHESIDWGSAVGTILGGVLDPLGVGSFATSFFQPRTTVTGIPSLGQQTSLAPAPRGAMQMQPGVPCPPIGPKYAKICLATNVITPLRRRRRRRLLTSSDIKDLAALKAIVGGAALQGAVVQAIRR